METVLNILNKEDNFGNSDESGLEGVIEVRYDGNWHEEEVREVLTEIIPYITEGCIDYEGEENCYWRYQFDAKLQQWNELSGTITYDNPKPFTKNTRMFEAYDIDWDVGIENVYDKIGNMSIENAAKWLEIPADRLANMNTEERMDYTYDVVHHCPAKADELFELPDKVIIPDEVSKEFGVFDGSDGFEDLNDEQAITDWLSEKYGFCINGYKIRKIA